LDGYLVDSQDILEATSMIVPYHESRLTKKPVLSNFPAALRQGRERRTQAV
jgi:hypothetical protein